MTTVPLLALMGVLAVVAFVHGAGPVAQGRARCGGGAGGRRRGVSVPVSLEGPDRRFLSGARIPLRAETRHDLAGVTGSRRRHENLHRRHNHEGAKARRREGGLGCTPAPAPNSSEPKEPAQHLEHPEPSTRSTSEPEHPAPGRPSFPQFLGPSRTGVIPDVRLARDWAAHPPKLIWKIPVGAGWSGFAIDRGLAITQEQRGGDEMVVAYDLLTGAPRWSHGDTMRYDSVIAGDGPRATPTIAGRLRRDAGVDRDGSTCSTSARAAGSGARTSPPTTRRPTRSGAAAARRSILDGKVIVSAGGGDGKSLVAYDARTGARVWSGGSDDSGYASPIVMTLLGRPQVVILNRVTLAGHDPATGRAAVVAAVGAACPTSRCRFAWPTTSCLAQPATASAASS